MSKVSGSGPRCWPWIRPVNSPRRHWTGVVSALLICGLMVYPCQASALRLTGSGASFPFPIYSTWFKQFSRAQRDTIVDYQAKGSGAGVRDFINRTVDFAASDAAMTDAEISQVEGGVVMIPLVAGAIVLGYNLPGIETLRLPRAIYPQIFAGVVRRWDDPAIVAANPGVTLPAMPITVVRRADSSGTTWAFTRHLNSISADWREQYGYGKTVQWHRSDKFIAAPKNDGVAATIKQTPGAIGYMEQAYAKFSGLPMALLENQAGSWVTANADSGVAALADTPLPEDRRIWLDDPSGDAAWPIVTYTWILAYRNGGNAEKSEALRQLLHYCLEEEGQNIAVRLGYIPLPAAIRRQVRAAVAEVN